MGSVAATRHTVRKGTHSCRECRRRKIKCIFSASDNRLETQKPAVCDSCRLRGLRCVSQASAVVKDARVPARRLAAKESHEHPNPGHRRQSQGHDLLSCSVADGARVAVVLGQNGGMDASLSQAIFGAPLSHRLSLVNNNHAALSAHLRRLLPDRPTISILLENGPSAFLVPSPSSSDDPQVRAAEHPTLVCRQLMMLALCLQQLPSSFDQSRLAFPKTLMPQKDGSGSINSSSIIRAWLDAVTWVLGCNDDLVANIEGLETLILEGIVYADAGFLRKAWMIGRKAISLAIMLGLSNPQQQQASAAASSISCQPGRVVSSQVVDSLWFRVNCIDRYASLVLGLPPASNDVAFASKERTSENTPEDRLGKTYAVSAGRICERNDMIRAGQDGKALTQSVELELEAVVHTMDEIRRVDVASSVNTVSGDLMVMNLQVRHYILVVMLHLPYISPSQRGSPDFGNGQEHSRAMGMHACRAVIHRFLRFRNVYKSSTTGRQMDYAALLSCTTLLQAHMMTRRQGSEHSLESSDTDLVGRARQRMEELAALNSSDSLSAESAKTISDLLTYLRSWHVNDSDSFAHIDALLDLDLGWFNLQPGLFDGPDPGSLFPASF